MKETMSDLWVAFPSDYAAVMAEDFKRGDDFLTMFEGDYDRNEYMKAFLLKKEKHAKSFRRRLNLFNCHRQLMLKRNAIEFWIYRSKEGKRFLPLAKSILRKIDDILSKNPLDYL